MTYFLAVNALFLTLAFMTVNGSYWPVAIMKAVIAVMLGANVFFFLQVIGYAVKVN